MAGEANSGFGALGSAAFGATPYGAAIGAAGSVASGVIGALNTPAPPSDYAKAGIKQVGSKSKDVYQFFNVAPNVTLAGTGSQTTSTGSSLIPTLEQRREFEGGSPTAAASLAKDQGRSEATASQGLGFLSGTTGRYFLIAAAALLAIFVFMKYRK